MWETTVGSRRIANAQNVILHEGLALFAEADAVYALSVSNGDVAWRFIPSSSADLCKIGAGSGFVYFGTRNHQVYAVDAERGVERWRVDIGSDWSHTGVVRGAVLSGDTLYVTAEEWLNEAGGSRRGHVIALSATEGAELWRSAGEGNWNTASSAARVVDRLVLVADLLGGFFAVDRFSGREAWRVQTAAYAFGVSRAPLARDGVVYAAAHGGVYAVNLADGALRWKREDLVGATDVVLCGDVLLVQNQTIQVLDPRNGNSLGSLFVDPVDFPTSDIVVDGDEAFVIGNVAAYALKCR